MSPQRIIMAVTNDLVTDQRVDRSCMALAEAGYEVTLVGRKLRSSFAVAPRRYRTQRMRLLFHRSAFFYAEYNLRLFFKLLVAQADVFYANDTDTLLACCCAARLRHKRLVFDAHELFPEVPELVDKPQVRKVWAWVERKCLPHVDVAFTVCQSVADEYFRRYGVKMNVLRNLPDWQREDCLDNGNLGSEQESYRLPPRTILYQGAVNVGRGVQELIDAMEFLPECHFVVAGNGDLLETLRDYAQSKPWSERVIFLGRVEPKQLHNLTIQARLGVCLLEDLGLNYRYSLPNRIADFAQAGVPILATDFCEIRNVIETYHIGTLTQACPHEKEGEKYRQYVECLAATIRFTLSFWEDAAPEDKQALFTHAAHDLCWQNEKKVLIDIMNTIIS